MITNFATNLQQICGKTKFFLKKVIKKQPLARSGTVATGSLGERFESVVFTFIIEKCSFWRQKVIEKCSFWTR